MPHNPIQTTPRLNLHLFQEWKKLFTHVVPFKPGVFAKGTNNCGKTEIIVWLEAGSQEVHGKKRKRKKKKKLPCHGVKKDSKPVILSLFFNHNFVVFCLESLEAQHVSFTLVSA